jgi:DNA repair protein RadC
MLLFTDYVENNVMTKCAEMGSEALSDQELLSIIIGKDTKTKTAAKMAEDMTKDEELYKQVVRCQYCEEIMDKYGVPQERAAAVLAALEIGKRIAMAKAIKRNRISSPKEAAMYIMPQMRYLTHEYFIVILLDTKNQVMDKIQISEGSLNCAVVHPREVYAPAIIKHAAAIVVAHNHPSGDPRPSDEDRELTRALVKTGEIIGIPVLDHVVIGDNKYYSFKEKAEL